MRLADHLSHVAAAFDEHGDLAYTWRENLRGLLASEFGREAGSRLWAEFELRCAERTMVFFQDKFPSCSLAGDLIEALRTQSAIDLEEKVDDLKLFLDDSFERGVEYFCAIYAGFAARAAALAFQDMGAAPPRREVQSELDFAPDEWDACFLGSIATCGGASWEGVGDNALRQEYWNWYVEMIVRKLANNTVVDRAE